MKMKLLIALLLLVPCALVAQQPATPAAYRIQVTLLQGEAGKAGTTHTLVLNAMPGATATLQAGDKIPITTGTISGGTQFTYDPVGLIVRCTLPTKQDIPGELRLVLHLETSAVVAAANGALPRDPVFRTAVADVSTVVPLGKATPVADLADVNHVARYQVQVLATPLP